MCLAAFALNADPRFPVVIAANRDEFFARPAAAIAWWRAGEVEVLSGRDLQAGGTWFGLTRAGRLALLTNVREPERQWADAPSRGALVLDWITGTEPAAAFAARLAEGYNGFNLITAEPGDGPWHWISNRAPAAVQLGPGVHGLSNAALDTPWPKTEGLKADLRHALAASASEEELLDRLLTALAQTEPAPDAQLPDTGVGLARERLLSPRFVRVPDPDAPGRARYGTRCSTVLVRHADGRLLVAERSVTADGSWLPTVIHRLPPQH